MVSKLSHVLTTGDFAVLLKAGMTVKQAIVYNLLSAMMAYIGMLIGTAVGQYANNITLWIFAITAGMFLYVALVDMVRCLILNLHYIESVNRMQLTKIEILAVAWKTNYLKKHITHFKDM